jgi:hypothetical protein
MIKSFKAVGGDIDFTLNTMNTCCRWSKRQAMRWKNAYWKDVRLY